MMKERLLRILMALAGAMAALAFIADLIDNKPLYFNIGFVSFVVFMVLALRRENMKQKSKKANSKNQNNAK